MNSLFDIILALLAAAGLLALSWLLFGRLLAPVGRRREMPVFAVLPAWGDGSHLEYDLAGLRWLRGGNLAKFTVILADAGLSETGRAAAAALMEQEPSLLFCSMEGLPVCIRACGGVPEENP